MNSFSRATRLAFETIDLPMPNQTTAENRGSILLTDESSKISLVSLSPVILGTFIVAGYAVSEHSLATFLAYMLFGLIGVFLARLAGKTGTELFIITYGVSAIAAVALYIIYTVRFGLPYMAGGSDDLVYELDAETVATFLHGYDSDNITSAIQFADHNSSGYVYLVSILIKLGSSIDGFNTMLPRLLNCAILGLASVLSFSIGSNLGLSSACSRIAGLWVGLLPIMIFTAIHTFRDIIVSLMILFAVRVSLSLRKTARQLHYLITHSLIIVMLAAIMGELRTQYIIVFAVILFLTLIISFWPGKTLEVKKPTAVILVIAAVAGAAAFWQVDLEFLSLLRSQLDGYNDQLMDAVDRGTVTGLGARLFGLDPPFSYIARAAYALVTPLPVFYQELEWNLLGVGTVVQFFFTGFVFLGMMSTYRDLRYAPLLSVFAILFFGYAMGTFTFRHIVGFLPLGIIFGVIGYEKYKNYRRDIFIGSGVLLSLLGAMYFYLKI